MKQKSNLKENEIQKRLKILIEDLFYISEVDAPIEIFEVHEKEINELKKEAETPKGSVQTVEEFFRPLAEQREWHTSAHRRRAATFRKLWRLFADELNEGAVYRIGRIRIKIYVVGKTADGNYLGIRTSAVET